MNEGLEEIQYNVFTGTKLKEIRIPKTCTKLGKHIVSDVSELKDVYLPQHLSEDANSYLGCSENVNIHIY